MASKTALNQETLENSELGAEIKHTQTKNSDLIVLGITNHDFIEEISQTDDGIFLLTLKRPVLAIQFKCNKCGYIWQSVSPNPKICPKCKNHKFWEELLPYHRKEKKKENEKNPDDPIDEEEFRAEM